MSKSGRDGLEPDIIVSILKHTSIPTVLVEGTGDVGIYRWLEKRLGVGKFDILQCGGRQDLFEIYKRRNEFLNKPVVFLADLDDYLYFGINVDYRDIIFTSGYSIENDAICNRSIKNLFEDCEEDDFYIALGRMIEIYSRKIVNRKIDKEEDLALHPMTFYNFDTSTFRDPNPYTSYIADDAWVDYIKQSPMMIMRGKNIVNLYTAILSRSSRNSKYSKENILEMHLKQSTLPVPMARILIRVKHQFISMGIAI